MVLLSLPFHVRVAATRCLSFRCLSTSHHALKEPRRHICRCNSLSRSQRPAACHGTTDAAPSEVRHICRYPCFVRRARPFLRPLRARSDVNVPFADTPRVRWSRLVSMRACKVFFISPLACRRSTRACSPTSPPPTRTQPSLCLLCLLSPCRPRILQPAAATELWCPLPCCPSETLTAQLFSDSTCVVRAVVGRCAQVHQLVGARALADRAARDAAARRCAPGPVSLVLGSRSACWSRLSTTRVRT